MSEVDGYLGEIEEGNKDSTGLFTIDWSKARERFAREARKEPSRYLVLLAQFALANRAPRIDIEVDAKTLTLRWKPERKTDANALRRLFAGLESGELPAANAALAYLRFVLLLLADRNDLSLTYNEEDVASFELSPTKMQIGPPLSEGTYARLRLQPGVERPETCSLLAIDLFHPIVSTRWTELSHLKEALTYPDAVITLNGSAVKLESGAPDSTLFCWATPASDSGPGLLLPKELTGEAAQGVGDSRGAVVEKARLSGRYRSLYLVGEFGLPDGTQRFRSTIRLVQDGRIVHSAPCPAFGMVVFCATQGLPMDVDGNRALESPEREAILSQTCEDALRFYAEVERRTNELTTWQSLSGIPKRLKFLANARARS